MKEVLKQLSLSAKIKPRQMYPIAIVGGMSEQKQQRLLKSKPDVVVATPGRLWALQQTVNFVDPIFHIQITILIFE